MVTSPSLKTSRATKNFTISRYLRMLRNALAKSANAPRTLTAAPGTRSGSRTKRNVGMLNTASHPATRNAVARALNAPSVLRPSHPSRPGNPTNASSPTNNATRPPPYPSAHPYPDTRPIFSLVTMSGRNAL